MQHRHSRIITAASLWLMASGLMAPVAQAQVPAGYPGKPWHDTVQAVPGILHPEDFDDGAINETWFDTDAHVGAYTARNPTGVDLDPVHANDMDVPGSTVKVVPGDIYWGWLVAGEWLKMTVDVKAAGAYTIAAMVGTAMTGTSFKVDALQGTDSVSSGALALPFSGTCPLECYHYWNYVPEAGQIQLKAGRQVIRLGIVKAGYNIQYVELKAAGTTGLRHAQVTPGTALARPDADLPRVDARGRALSPAALSVRAHARQALGEFFPVR